MNIITVLSFKYLPEINIHSFKKLKVIISRSLTSILFGKLLQNLDIYENIRRVNMFRVNEYCSFIHEYR